MCGRLVGLYDAINIKSSSLVGKERIGCLCNIYRLLIC